MPFSNLPKGATQGRNISILLRHKNVSSSPGPLSPAQSSLCHPLHLKMRPSSAKVQSHTPMGCCFVSFRFFNIPTLFCYGSHCSGHFSTQTATGPPLPDLHRTVAPCLLSGFCALRECLCYSQSQPYVFSPLDLQISLKIVSPPRASSSLFCSPFYLEVLIEQECVPLSVTATPFYILLCTVERKPRILFSSGLFQNSSQFNSANGDTYVRFKRQKKRRNRYSPVQLQTGSSDHRALFPYSSG